MGKREVYENKRIVKGISVNLAPEKDLREEPYHVKREKRQAERIEYNFQVLNKQILDG